MNSITAGTIQISIQTLDNRGQVDMARTPMAHSAKRGTKHNGHVFYASHQSKNEITVWVDDCVQHFAVETGEKRDVILLTVELADAMIERAAVAADHAYKAEHLPSAEFEAWHDVAVAENAAVSQKLHDLTEEYWKRFSRVPGRKEL